MDGIRQNLSEWIAQGQWSKTSNTTRSRPLHRTSNRNVGVPSQLYRKSPSSSFYLLHEYSHLLLDRNLKITD